MKMFLFVVVTVLTTLSYSQVNADMYTPWTDWTPCTKTCGGGITSRVKSCTNPKPEIDYTIDCTCIGPAEETKACAEDACPDTPQICNEALDIGIIMDGSLSVEESGFGKAKDFFKNLTNYFTVSPQGTHFGVIVYSTKAKMEFTFADTRYHDPKALSDRIEAIVYPRGGTRTDRALKMASNKLFTPVGGDRLHKPNVLIVFTDGKTSSWSKPYSKVLPPLQAKDVRIIAIGVSGDVSKKELTTIALEKSENVFMIDNIDGLQDILDAISLKSCKE